MVTDACATMTQERHDAAVASLRGYCRQQTTDTLVAELEALVPAGKAV
jgi:ureidoacrylate peracid hydrolase